MDIKIELNNVAAQFQKAHADALQSIIDEEKRSYIEIETQKSQLGKKLERDRAKVYNKIANTVSQIDTILKDIVQVLRSKDNGTLTVAEYIELGTLKFSGKQYRLNGDIEIPLILPFLGHTNLFVTAKAAEISTISQQLVWQSLNQTAAGQLRVKVYDPNLSRAMSPFTTLGEEMKMMQIISQENELEELLLSLTKDVRNITSQIRGTSKNLVDFRQKTNQAIGMYRVIVLLDFPLNIKEKSAGLLLSLLKSAPMAGISFIIINTKEVATPEYIDIPTAKNMCQSIKVGSSRLIWENKNNLEASFALLFRSHL